jgi:hypothetical protein
MRSSKMIEGAVLKVYPGLPHGMCSTHKDVINADLLEFLKTKVGAAAAPESRRPEGALPQRAPAPPKPRERTRKERV